MLNATPPRSVLLKQLAAIDPDLVDHVEAMNLSDEKLAKLLAAMRSKFCEKLTSGKADDLIALGIEFLGQKDC